MPDYIQYLLRHSANLNWLAHSERLTLLGMHSNTTTSRIRLWEIIETRVNQRLTICWILKWLRGHCFIPFWSVLVEIINIAAETDLSIIAYTSEVGLFSLNVIQFMNIPIQLCFFRGNVHFRNIAMQFEWLRGTHKWKRLQSQKIKKTLIKLYVRVYIS